MDDQNHGGQVAAPDSTGSGDKPVPGPVIQVPTAPHTDSEPRDFSKFENDASRARTESGPQVAAPDSTGSGDKPVPIAATPTPSAPRIGPESAFAATETDEAERDRFAARFFGPGTAEFRGGVGLKLPHEEMATRRQPPTAIVARPRTSKQES